MSSAATQQSAPEKPKEQTFYIPRSARGTRNPDDNTVSCLLVRCRETMPSSGDSCSPDCPQPCISTPGVSLMNPRVRLQDARGVFVPRSARGAAPALVLPGFGAAAGAAAAASALPPLTRPAGGRRLWSSRRSRCLPPLPLPLAPLSLPRLRRRLWVMCSSRLATPCRDGHSLLLPRWIL